MICDNKSCLQIFVDSDSDTIITADSVFASPIGSMVDLQHMSSANIPLLYTGSATQSSNSTDNTTAGALSLVTADDRYHHQTTELHSKSTKSSSSSSSEGSSDTLVDAASMVSISLASSCNTYISEGGDAYKCARNEFRFKRRRPKNALPSSSRQAHRSANSSSSVWDYRRR